MTTISHHIAETAAAIGAKTNYGASIGLVVIGGLTSEEWTIIAILAGIFFAAAGFLTQTLMTWYFKSKTLKLEQMRIEAEMARNNANNQPRPHEVEDRL
jgi:phosphotransferase system  glucose/maltose/N-acetylglucosamine-specific IIC component